MVIVRLTLDKNNSTLSLKILYIKKYCRFRLLSNHSFFEIHHSNDTLEIILKQYSNNGGKGK